jgi:hypothetical protein
MFLVSNINSKMCFNNIREAPVLCACGAPVLYGYILNIRHYMLLLQGAGASAAAGGWGIAVLMAGEITRFLSMNCLTISSVIFARRYIRRNM